ncbi:MAG: methyltransferase domain-containing protein [Rhodospirillaceae bacterium]|nr:methyltransferase domain-containing protein [Rhodospirillaceae bacterium]
MATRKQRDSKKRNRRSRTTPIDRGEAVRASWAAAERGDLRAAQRHLKKAIKSHPNDAELHHNLGEIVIASGDVEAAAQCFALALAFNPSQRPSAERLSEIVAQFELAEPQALPMAGLVAAFACDRCDLHAIASVGFSKCTVEPPLVDLIATGRECNWQAAAQDGLGHSDQSLFTHELLRLSLAHGINRVPDLENLFCALRRELLLAWPPERLLEEPVAGFALALFQQCLNSEHVWHETVEEHAYRHDVDNQIPPLIHALYEPLERLIDLPTFMVGAALAPDRFGEVIAARRAERDQEAALANSLPVLCPLKIGVSNQVAQQYENSPYPRWTKLNLPSLASKRPHLEKFVGTDGTDFFDAPFHVLIAGCGTGRQAIQSAHAYGLNAQTLAIDLSRASLTYASRKAAAYGTPNIRFMQADILDAHQLARKFDVIECMGVLHHMADPLAGWHKLSDCLKPGGVMMLGLYSEIARADIVRLRAAIASEGLTASNDDIRQFRHQVLRGRLGDDGATISKTIDFFSLSGCRDLVFHTQEHRTSIPELSNTMEDLGLEFLGFSVNKSVELSYREAYPGDPAGLSLANWDQFEMDNPETFRAMYKFWCRKPA